MEQRRDRLHALVSEGQPMTVRNAYYRAVVAGIVPKTKAGYRIVQRDLAEMRRAGALPFAWLADNTRWMLKPTSHNSLQDALESTARLYRRNLWADSDERVEVWCESDSIAGVLYDVTEKWDVPLLPTRGYSSLTFTYSMAQTMNHDGRPVVVYYVGDHDPAGFEIERSLHDGLAEHLAVPFRFERVGVTWDQVEQYDLPGGEPKKNYGFPLAVEAEALPAPDLRRVLTEAIVQHIDAERLAVLEVAEESEREMLFSFADRIGGAA